MGSSVISREAGRSCSSSFCMTSQRRGLSEHIILILIIIGALAYGIDRLLFWFQRGLFPFRAVED